MYLNIWTYIFVIFMCSVWKYTIKNGISAFIISAVNDSLIPVC